MKDRKFLRIVKNAMKGNEESFDLLMRLRSRNILYIAISIMQDKNVGEEIAQEAATLMQRNISKLKSPEAFDSWMYRIIYNECMDEKKRMAKVWDHKEIDSGVEEMVLEKRDEFLPEEFVSQEEKRTELLAAINELPDKYRMCVLMFYYEEMNYQEIADVMDISGHDVANYLRRAKKKLRQQLVGGEVQSPELSSKGVQTKSAGALAATPVIAQAFSFDENNTVTSSMVERFIAANAASAVAISASTAAVGSVVGIGGSVAVLSEKLNGPMLAKAATSFVCAVVVAGGVFYAVTQGDPDLAGQDPTNKSEVERVEGILSERPTKEDIIKDAGLSESQAEQLTEFATSETTEEEWSNFVEKTQLYYLGKTLDRTSTGDYQYSVYLFDDPQAAKLLITIERKNNNNNVSVTYNTFVRGSAPLENQAIIEAFNAWQ